MTNPTAHQGERRAHPRYVPDDVRIRLTSTDFEDKQATVNFAKRLINVCLKGACVETAGRLRPDVKLKLEMRFDDLGSTLMSDVRVVWADTDMKGSVETHKVGLEFVGDVMIGRPIREYLQGGNRELIQARREMEYSELKRKADTRKEAAGRKWGPVKKFIAAILILGFLYAGSFWGLVFRGRIDSPEPGITFRYLDPGPEGGETEELLATLYDPVYRLCRLAGIPVHYRPSP